MDLSYNTLLKPPSKRVLVVDDAPVNRIIARKLLEHLGHNIIEANSGADALNRLKFGTFDMVLLDIYMPGINGFDVIEAIRGGEAGNSRVPLVALTADETCRERCFELGIDAWATKPLRLATLSRLMLELFRVSIAETTHRLKRIRR